MFPDDPSLGLHIIVPPWLVLYTHSQCHADEGWGRKDSCFHISLLKGTVSRAFDPSFFTCLFLLSDRLSQPGLFFRNRGDIVNTCNCEYPSEQNENIRNHGELGKLGLGRSWYMKETEVLHLASLSFKRDSSVKRNLRCNIDKKL